MKIMGNKRLFFLLLGMILFITLMGLTLGGRTGLTWPEKFVKDTISTAQGWLYKPAGSIAGFFRDLRELQVIYRENKELKKTLIHYAEDTQHLNDLEAENKRLKIALAFTEQQKQSNNYKYHIADVVAVSPDAYNHTITINLGEKDGIKPNMAVVTPQGLIGRIQTVTPFHSDVQLLTNLNDTDNNTKAISVTVRGKETSSFGVIESYEQDKQSGKDYLVMTKVEQADPTHAIAVGDTVITSGLGQVFPPGLMVGKVASIGVGEFNITPRVLVEPFASFTHIQEVFVVEAPVQQ
ncbi:rod shape-determining protein MreC [Gordoniibacillus kamchatkensis]|uniref:Cell shape-determining protein MreC n=1 Tax=Gordoniibacillus kamchatkensis TaxID=1590651 RepID=A0ABR5AJ59_9BACL|nr:rod shape-determining protein MreC [Paenibacillus sp. VKM B-2647]KIL41087.1 rod shape-determining protein MreC [Paenibacillus sp. VKM B-2647]